MPLISPLMPVSQIDRVRLRVNHESSVCVDIYGVCVCVCSCLVYAVHGIWSVTSNDRELAGNCNTDVVQF